ncbi:MAG: sulfurtransferase [Pyrinomonadaceae bacterium]|nr:sulfurtransferase [Pyrinomonadaceae bacterium]
MKSKYISAISVMFVMALLATGSVTTILGQTAKQQMLVSTNWLARNLNKVTVLHVGRDQKRYDTGHIPGARFVAWKEIAILRDGVPNELPPLRDLQKLFTELGIGNTRRVVIYGDVRGLYAARAFFTLDYLGHGNRVALLNGGLEKWTAEKRKVSKEAEKRRPANFTPNVQINKVAPYERVMDVSWSAKNLKRPRVALVDARPYEFFTGEKKSKSNKRAGHIPGAKSIYWMNHLVSAENPVMLPKGALRKMYESKGITRSKKIVVYCQSGGQASHGYFTLRYLGYDVVMYDGSFGEWSNKPDTEVAVIQQ